MQNGAARGAHPFGGDDAGAGGLHVGEEKKCPHTAYSAVRARFIRRSRGVIRPFLLFHFLPVHKPVQIVDRIGRPTPFRFSLRVPEAFFHMPQTFAPVF